MVGRKFVFIFENLLLFVFACVACVTFPMFCYCVCLHLFLFLRGVNPGGGVTPRLCRGNRLVLVKRRSEGITRSKFTLGNTSQGVPSLRHGGCYGGRGACVCFVFQFNSFGGNISNSLSGYLGFVVRGQPGLLELFDSHSVFELLGVRFLFALFEFFGCFVS